MARRTTSNRAAVMKGLRQHVMDVTAKLTLEADRKLKEASPVDTGEFRGKWEATTPTKPGEAGHVTNAAPHAVPLANGHSPQAPAGWIENELQAVVKEV